MTISAPLRPRPEDSGVTACGDLGPIEAYRALLAARTGQHWRSGCPCCDAAHPCEQATALLTLLEFIA